VIYPATASKPPSPGGCGDSTGHLGILGHSTGRVGVSLGCHGSSVEIFGIGGHVGVSLEVEGEG
jgi:hypothetical protein